MIRASLAAMLVVLPGVAFAQQTVPSGGGSSGAQASGGGGAGAPGVAAGGSGASTGGVTTTTAVPFYPGGVAPTPPGTVLGGGNTRGVSSSTPKVGNEEDTFDLGGRGAGGGSVYGSQNGPVYINGPSSVTLGEGNADWHLVRRGDTLWAICDTYFRNPYQWPRIWSYNPQIQNPHWIYPGDQVRLRAGAGPAPSAPAATPGERTQVSMVDRRRQVPPDTIFLRDQGFVGDDEGINWGEISGAREDKMFMTNFDEVYLKIGPDHDVKIGQELTVFRPLKKVEGGNLVQLQGTVKVDQWNPKERVARAQVTEALDVIERGARIGPVGRRFEVVAPVRNDVDVRGSIVTSVHPHPFYGQYQVVFINKGETAGLKPGNRLFVVRRGDAWHQSMERESTGSAAQRIALESESAAEIERVPRRDDAKYPEEVVGELRVLAVRKETSACVMTRSLKEIERGDTVVARKGY
jgi:hypothetical protein